MQASSILLKRAMFALYAGRIELGSYQLIFKFYRLEIKNFGQRKEYSRS